MERLGDEDRTAVEAESLRGACLVNGRRFSSFGREGKLAGAVRGMSTGGEVCREAF